MIDPPRCHVICHTDSAHLSQIFTGLALLHKSGEIVLSQECRIENYYDFTKPLHLQNARHAHLRLVLNGNATLYFDCHDSSEIDEAGADADCYFKRSYARAAVPESLKDKVFPLGLNYPVRPARFDKFSRERISAFNGDLPGLAVQRFRPTVEMYCVPADLKPRILFMTRAWDPFDIPGRSDEKVAERITINEVRARCIELLRREFGERFLGGFEHTDFAARNYPRALLPDNAASAKENYVELLREYPICIATSGLYGSIGWKMGEYVAFSRAIVSERLNYEVSGDFRAGENYLEFGSPEGCVTAAHKLFSDPSLRCAMMKNNHDYYLAYLKPDSLVRRCLKVGLSYRGE